jgi:hypothetical protein
MYEEIDRSNGPNIKKKNLGDHIPEGAKKKKPKDQNP